MGVADLTVQEETGSFGDSAADALAQAKQALHEQELVAARAKQEYLQQRSFLEARVRLMPGR